MAEELAEALLRALLVELVADLGVVEAEAAVRELLAARQTLASEPLEAQPRAADREALADRVAVVGEELLLLLLLLCLLLLLPPLVRQLLKGGTRPALRLHTTVQQRRRPISRCRKRGQRGAMLALRGSGRLHLHELRASRVV